MLSFISPIKITAQKRKNILSLLRKGGWLCLLGNICGVLATLYTIVDIASMFDATDISNWTEDRDWLLAPFLAIGVVLGSVAFLFGPTGEPQIMKEILKRTTISVFVSSWDILDSANKKRLKKILKDIANRDISNWEIVFTSCEKGGDASEKTAFLNADMAILLFSRSYVDKFGENLYRRIIRRALMGRFFVYPILVENDSDVEEESYGVWDDQVKYLKEWTDKVCKAPHPKDIQTLSNNHLIQDAYCAGDPQTATWEKIRHGIEHIIHELEDYKSGTLPDFMLDSFKSGIETQYSIYSAVLVDDDDDYIGVTVNVPLEAERVDVAVPLNAHSKEYKSALYVHCITKFWSDPPPVNTLVTMTGTLSCYAPLVPGSPYEKRKQHLKFRKEEKEYDKESVNTAMAFTAGQMPWRLPPGRKRLHYMGFYQAITRNSIPVFMSDACYQSLPQIIPQDIDSKGFEAKITARVINLPEEYNQLHNMSKWMSERSYKNYYGKKKSSYPLEEETSEEEILTDVGPLYALEIIGNGDVKDQGDGKKYIDGVEYICPTKYLDGDIWVAVSYKGKTEFASRFCDLSDEEDIRKQVIQIQSKELSDMPGYKVLHQFDEVEKRFYDID